MQELLTTPTKAPPALLLWREHLFTIKLESTEASADNKFSTTFPKPLQTHLVTMMTSASLLTVAFSLLIGKFSFR